MSHLRHAIRFAVAISLVTALCSCKPEDKSMLLEDWDVVYVPLDPATLTSMGEMTPDMVGTQQAKSMEYVFQYVDSTFNDGSGQAVIVYSDEFEVPSETIFAEMRVWECYQAVLDDPNAAGIHVNYGSSGKNPYTVSKSELRGAISRLPRPNRIGFNICIKR